jgi:hypothetical protein
MSFPVPIPYTAIFSTWQTLNTGVSRRFHFTHLFLLPSRLDWHIEFIIIASVGQGQGGRKVAFIKVS